MNNNKDIIDRIKGVPMQKGTWRDKFDPRNPNVPQDNDNQKAADHSPQETASE